MKEEQLTGNEPYLMCKVADFCSSAQFAEAEAVTQEELMATRKKAIAPFVERMASQKKEAEAQREEKKLKKKNDAAATGPVTRAKLEPSDLRAMIRSEFAEFKKSLCAEVSDACVRKLIPEVKKQRTHQKKVLDELAQIVEAAAATVKSKRAESRECTDEDSSEQVCKRHKASSAKAVSPVTHQHVRQHKEKVARATSSSSDDENSGITTSYSPQRDREPVHHHKSEHRHTYEHSAPMKSDHQGPDHHKHQMGSSAEKKGQTHHTHRYKA